MAIIYLDLGDNFRPVNRQVVLTNQKWALIKDTW